MLSVSRADELKLKLRVCGLRPTRQRLLLSDLLFTGSDRHVCADSLYAEALSSNLSVSKATVYNTLHQFHEAGLLRVISIDSSKTYYDTNISEHHHFFIEGENRIYDVPACDINVSDLPVPPAGMEIDRVDVIVRLKPS